MSQQPARSASGRIFVGVDDDVIERESIVTPLKFDSVYSRAGKAPRLGTGEHREEVVSTNLALEAGTRRSSRSWARTAQTFLANPIDASW